VSQRAYHFSHDPTITSFEPHVAATSAEPAPYVWAIDAEHAPAYWFPRDCPRVTCWPAGPPAGQQPQPPSQLAAALLAGATRVHAIEWAWLDRMRQAVLYRYEFNGAQFRPYRNGADGSGYLVADRPVRPVLVRSVGDLLQAHHAAGIELRLVSNLWPLADAVVASGLEFSLIRMRYATPRRQ